MYNREDSEFTFMANKIEYTVENLGNSIEVYETDNPLKTGFIFDGGLKHFILFINRLTDIAEDISKEEEENEIEEFIWAL